MSDAEIFPWCPKHPGLCLALEQTGTPQPILTTALLLAEDTYTSEELVDQQPVLLKVMDTADEVRHRDSAGAKRLL